MEKYRLNLQVGNMLQHVMFVGLEDAASTFTRLCAANKAGIKQYMLDETTMIDASAIVFAALRKV